MSKKANLDLNLSSPLSRQTAERISAVEGLYMSAAMKSQFTRFDGQGLTGDERRTRLLAQYITR